MSGSYELVTLVGHLGRDPEMRFSPAMTAITSFSIATDREYTKDDQKVKEVHWFRISVFGKAADRKSVV
jgi:single-strand DNA-binding protein